MKWPKTSDHPDDVDYMIDIETRRWIVAHYVEIGNAALHSLRLVKPPGSTIEALDPNDALIIDLVAE
jgi:hypothetical protein